MTTPGYDYDKAIPAGFYDEIYQRRAGRQGHTFIAATTGLVIDVIWRFVVSNRLIWGRSSILRKPR